MKGTYIDADHPYIQYTGRMDFTDPKSVLMIYPGSYIKVRFEGSSISLRFSQEESDWGNYIGYIIDDIIEGKILLEENTEDKSYKIIDGLEDKEHLLTIFRRADFTRGRCFFNGVILEPGKSLLPPPPRPGRRIEVYGDSITAGEVSEAYGYEGKLDPEETAHLSNAWYSYANILARMLEAEIHNVGQGGLALQDGYGYCCQPDTIGLETTFDKLIHIPYLGGYTYWDFKKYTPHIVIIAIGQNDSSTHPDVVYDEKLRTIWKEKYLHILRTLRNHHKDAYFILTTSLMYHDIAWDDLIEEIRIEFNDPKVKTYRYKRLGKGTPGHIRRSEAQEMAEELALFIGTLDDPWQEEIR